MANLQTKKFRVALVGNPNVGKTTIFNLLCKANQYTGNWSGVTVEKEVGLFEFENTIFELIDLPGIYSLYCHQDSIDKGVTVRSLLTEAYDFIINIVDASNLERNLYLTTQLLELGLPVCVIVNMIDIAKKKNIAVKAKTLSHFLGIQTVALSAKQGNIQDEIGLLLLTAYSAKPNQKQYYPKQMQQAIKSIAKQLPFASKNLYYAIKLLESDDHLNLCRELNIDKKVSSIITSYKEKINNAYGEEIGILLASARYEHIKEIAKLSAKKQLDGKSLLSDKLDNIFLNYKYGITCFIVIMFCLFTFSMVIGNIFKDAFTIVSNFVFIDGVGFLLQKLFAPSWLIDLLAEGIGGGITTVCGFIPVIGALYLFLSALEDSGYLTRAALLMNRLMTIFGLPGKAIVPLIVGFGCNVPAIMSTRVMEDKSAKILTVLMIPFMSCSGRLAVYALFCTAFFKEASHLIVFSLYLIGIFIALFTAFLFKASIKDQEHSYCIIELNDYQLPNVRNILRKTYTKLKEFSFNAGKLIIITYMVLHLLYSVSLDGGFDNRDMENSLLVNVSKKASHIFKPMGVREDNWPAIVGLFTGVFAKEVVVGTLNSLYGDLRKNEQKEYVVAPLKIIKEVLSSIKQNALTAFTNANSQVHDNEIFKPINIYFDGKIGAYAYLLFILLYFPCISAFATIAQEINLKWALLSVSWSTVVAYVVAVLFYQLSKMYLGEAFSLISIVWSVIIFFSTCGLLSIFIKSKYASITS